MGHLENVDKPEEEEYLDNMVAVGRLELMEYQEFLECQEHKGIRGCKESQDIKEMWDKREREGDRDR